MSNAFGEKIRALRKEKKLTLEQLAELSGSSKSYIWELENKNPPRPSADKLTKIAEALGTTVDYLMGTSGQQEKADATDIAFFRKYQTMEPDQKEQIRKMLEIIQKK
ncbi:helix-turn-helix transcriptional regulator [Methylosinus sp. Ce-a6]|uniref:helix-turn-helix domain-containing protein n=1 Tax=Methylosinus sp. Ce-a6 TaxID=2172005 RepID=UPI001FCE5BA2